MKSEKDLQEVFNQSQEDKQERQHLTRERKMRRNKPAAILKKQDLEEEKLHEYFTELMQHQYQLEVVQLDWSFISDFPLLRRGKGAICPEFFDGLSYPEELGEGKTPAELINYLQKVFMNNGPMMRKCDQKKAQSYFKKKQMLHKPYFIKLDDRCYNFTEKRIAELQAITAELQVDMLKLDVTIDCAGCFYVSNLDKLSSSLLGEAMEKLGFGVRRCYNQSPTCVSFERDDIIVTIYNKPIQRFESDLVTKKIGNGLQTIFGSEQIAEKFLACQETSFFRIELRFRFDSRLVTFTEWTPTDFHKRATEIFAAVQEKAYQSKVIYKVPILTLWAHLWKQVKQPFIVVSKNFVTIVHGQNPYTTKYFGATYSMGKNKPTDKFIKKFLKIYGLSGRAHYVLKFQDQKRYHLQEWKKTASPSALLLRTLFKENYFKKVHLQRKTLTDFGLGNVDDIHFQPCSSGIVSAVTVQVGEVLHDTLSRRIEAAEQDEWVCRVEKRYKKTKEAAPLKRAREFIYFKFNDYRKTLYMYNTKDTSAKFRYKLATHTQYAQVKISFDSFVVACGESCQQLQSDAYIFCDFSVKVIPRFGELIFIKDNTDETSSNDNISDKEEFRVEEEKEQQQSENENQQHNNVQEESNNQPAEVSAFADEQEIQLDTTTHQKGGSGVLEERPQLCTQPQLTELRVTFGQRRVLDDSVRFTRLQARDQDYQQSQLHIQRNICSAQIEIPHQVDTSWIMKGLIKGKQRWQCKSCQKTTISKEEKEKHQCL